MKTETKIAVENIKLLKQRMQTLETNARRKGLCISHKASCQRFLEFMEREEFNVDIKFIEEKITDLKNAIKKYNTQICGNDEQIRVDEAGI